jgi:hypothetical protein
MYQLLVYYPGKAGVQATFIVERAAEVLDLIPKLLAEHRGCERVVVMLDQTRLFAVDCAGNRLP